VLQRLDPTDLALLRRVDRTLRAAVESCDLPRAGVSQQVPLKVGDFVGSVERLAWVGPGRYCSPRHPTNFEPSSLELYDTL